MPFKQGDKVKVINNELLENTLRIGDVFTIAEILPGGRALRVVEKPGKRYMFYRFELVEEAAPALKVGDLVRILGPYESGPHEPQYVDFLMEQDIGKELRINEICEYAEGYYRAGKWLWKASSLELVVKQQPVKKEEEEKEPRVLKKGDMVFIVKKPDVVPDGYLFTPEMEWFVGDGLVHEITFVHPGIKGRPPFYRIADWAWLAESLQHVDALPQGDGGIGKEIVEGSRVYIVKDCSDEPNNVGWNHYMQARVNDGKVYIVSELRPYLDDQMCNLHEEDSREDTDYLWDVRALKLAERKPVEKDAPAVKVKKKVVKESLLKSLAAKVKGKSMSGSHYCSYAIQYSDGKIRHQVNDVCHARIGWGGYWEERDNLKLKGVSVALNISQFHKDKLPTEESRNAYIRYADYIINHSPWKVAFKGKRISSVVKNGVLMNTSQVIHRLAGAAVALREGLEFSTRLPVFIDVLEAGYSGHVAYLTSMALSRSQGNLSMNNMNGGHQALNGNLKSKDIFEFFVKGFKDKKEDVPYREMGSGYYIQAYIGDETGGKTNFRSFIEEHCPFKRESRGLGVGYVFEEGAVLKLAAAIDNALKEVK